MKTTLIALVGMPGAGKSTCVDYLVDKGVPSIYFGGVVVDEATRRYGKAKEDGEKLVREEFRRELGMAAIAIKAVPKIEEALISHGRAVLDGLYSWSEYKFLKEKYGEGLQVVAIAAPRKARHARLAKRPIRPLTDEEVSAREYAEIENIEKGGPIANADFTLLNDKDAQSLLDNFKLLLDELKFFD